MDFGLSEEQTLFQDTLLSFLADQVGLERVRRIAGGDESPTLCGRNWPNWASPRCWCRKSTAGWA